jgi:ABC-type transporter Mla maintaining outer membrane lipid asymmetry permease subunit MlaE
MSKKKLISIVISAILSIIAAILGCVYGIDVDFSGVDVGDKPTPVICSAMTHEQP